MALSTSLALMLLLTPSASASRAGEQPNPGQQFLQNINKIGLRHRPWYGGKRDNPNYDFSSYKVTKMLVFLFRRFASLDTVLIINCAFLKSWPAIFFMKVKSCLLAILHRNNPEVFLSMLINAGQMNSKEFGTQIVQPV